jgi:hypothetical protein
MASREHFVYPVAGNLVDLVEVELLETSGNVPWPPRSPSLLFFMSDRCAKTKDMLPTWLQLLENSALRSRSTLILVSIDGREVADAIFRSAPSSMSKVIIRPKSVAQFISKTGFTSTPSTVVLDRESRITRVLDSRSLRLRPEQAFASVVEWFQAQ